MGGREEFTLKEKNNLRGANHLCECIAVESDSRIRLLYSNNAAL